MAVSKFLDLPVKDIPWGSKTQIENELLGSSNDWERYQKAHLWYDPDDREVKSGYKLPFAKMDGGKVTAVHSQLSAAIAALNGARGGVDISEPDRKAAYALAVRYLKKFNPKAKPPELKSAQEKSGDDWPHDLNGNGTRNPFTF